MNGAPISLMHAPVRMCVICRQRYLKSRLRRYILNNGNFQMDEAQQSPGRGWYCCDNPNCIQRFAQFRPKKVRHQNGAADEG